MAWSYAGILVLIVAVSTVLTTSPVLARKPTRRLNGGGGYSPYGYSPKSGSSPMSGYSPKSGSSPMGGSPYGSTPTPSGGSPTPSGGSPTPYYGGSPTPSGGSPMNMPPVNIPPVSSTPTGGYGGYGSRSGKGTSGFFKLNPGSIPKVLSLISSLVKLFGPRLLKFFQHGKPPSLLEALKTESNLPIDVLNREASASLINTYLYKDFPISAADVIAQFNSALESPEMIAVQAIKFQQLNEGV
ncbi:hypothetical protein KP509_03G093300 [Ceratopteris richardii]|uniref:Uncharacterized protein n=1 Tax=Ceratopteris richardii TaxID=49495 RepID=A0A8T2V562_CERRI|nr:hypothetical protein KP509_03G093300 [Ceratopteris richardii]